MPIEILLFAVATFFARIEVEDNHIKVITVHCLRNWRVLLSVGKTVSPANLVRPRASCASTLGISIGTQGPRL